MPLVLGLAAGFGCGTQGGGGTGGATGAGGVSPSGGGGTSSPTSTAGGSIGGVSASAGQTRTGGSSASTTLGTTASTSSARAGSSGTGGSTGTVATSQGGGGGSESVSSTDVMGQFSKFVRPGAFRVNTPYQIQNNVNVQAYAGEKNVIIALNRGTSSVTQTFTIVSGAFANVKRTTTSNSKKLADDGVVTLTNSSFTATLDPQSITTFVGE